VYLWDDSGFSDHQEHATYCFLMVYVHTLGRRDVGACAIVALGHIDLCILAVWYQRRPTQQVWRTVNEVFHNLFRK